MVKPAQWQWSGFSCGKTCCNGSVPGRNRTRNRPGDLEPLLTLTLAIGSGCRRPMGFPLRWLVRWHKSQLATYRWVSRHICFQKYRSFIRMYARSAPKCPPAGVSWASWSIRRCIVLGIHNRPLISAFPTSSFSFALAVLFTCVFSKSPRNHRSPLSSK